MANETQNNTVTVQAPKTIILPNRFKGETYVSRNATEADVQARIKEMAAGNQDNQDELHKLAIDCLDLAFNPKHNNFDVATQFLKMVEETYSYSAARLQIKKWFTTFGPYRLVQKDGKESFRKSNSEKANPFDLQGAYENPWYTLGVRETRMAEAIADMTADSVIDSVSRMLSKLNGQLKDIEAGKIKLRRPEVDLPVLQHIRNSLVAIETQSKKERDILKDKLLDQKETSKAA